MNSQSKGAFLVPSIRQTLIIYSVALIFTFATFLLRQSLSVTFGERPLLILYMFPIIISALLGGFGPGLTATLVAAVCTAFVIPPADSFAMAAGHDIMQWSMLITNGVLVSLLSEYIHRLRKRETVRWQQLELTQSRLRQSETRFQSTFDQAAVGMALVAPDGRWLRVNRKLCEIVGYNQEELLVRKFQDITHPDDLNANLSQMRRTLSGEIESYSMEKRYLRKDGGPVWINLTVALAWKPDATPDYFIAIVEDIHARKLAETELRLWAQSFKHAHFGLAIADAENDIFLAVNPSFADERGYSQGEMVGKPVMMVYPSNLTEDIKNKIKALDVTSHGVFETEHIRKDGRHFPVLMDITVIKSVDGQPVTRIAYALDITERKQAELALRDSEQRFRQLFSLAPIPLAFVNQDSAVVAINDRFVSTFGYTHADIPTLVEWWPLAYPDTDYRRSVMDAWNAAVQRAMVQNTDIEPMEYRITCKNGGVRIVVISGIMIGTDFLVTLVDTTEHRAAEAALRTRERYQRALLDNFPFMVWLKDSDSRILAANKTYAKIANVADPDALVGTTDFDYWDAKLAEHYQAEDRVVLESGRPKVCEEEITEAGRRFWIETYKSPVELDGRIIGTVGFARDITQRKQSELALCESEARFRALVEQSLAGIYIIQNDRFCYVNPGFAVIFGYDAPEAIIEHVTVADLVCPEDRERVAENLRQRIDGEITNIRYIFTGLRQDGSRIAIEAHGRAFEYQGKPAVIGFILDITARKSAEDALLRQAEELARRNAELERFNRATVGRELDMIALKQQVNKLSVQLGQAPPYPLSFLDAPPSQQQQGKPL